jgi:hypothetical protein
MLDRNSTPSHLFDIPELDFSDDLFSDRLAGPWFRLAARTTNRKRNKKGVDEEISRRCFLVSSDGFAVLYEKLNSNGNVMRGMGKPGGAVSHIEGEKQYRYLPFHQFEIPFSSVIGEPLVFLDSRTPDTNFFINPDILLFFEFEERSGQGIWLDPKSGIDALVRRKLNDDSLETVEIRTEYLLKYLQARQMSLIIGHYRQLLLYSPSENATQSFVKEDLILGSVDQGVEAILDNWGLRTDVGRTPFLQRRLHLWLEIKPPTIDIEDPWSDQPAFDLFSFTIPTKVGPVAIARFKKLRTEERDFEGVECDFMEPVYFRQEVLRKYEGASGFVIGDDGSVTCRYFWALNRSTSRVGNELLCTYIGDFAEGVPYEEWPHWKQFAIAPPSIESLRALDQEPAISDTVNSLVNAFKRLNDAFEEMARSLTPQNPGSLWQGSLDSLAGRQLKWFYPHTADDDEFLKRATLASTLFIEGLQSSSIRKLLGYVDANLHQTFDNLSKSLGSRKLLQRVTLLAVVLAKFRPHKHEIADLLKTAEHKSKSLIQNDLEIELKNLNQQVQEDFSPLAFLYDLRLHGGLAHPPNKAEASVTAQKLGLSAQSWQRADFLQLLKLIADSVIRISIHFESI